MIGQTIAHYKITGKLGAGGMGLVFLADDTKLERRVALKFLPRHFSADEEARARFLREAKALAALNHPNIVSVYDVSEHDGVPFIAMEYVEGQSLKQLVQSGDLDIQQILDITFQVCEGLAAAHEEKIVHRDIKSDNIILSSKGRAKIMDFGLATWQGLTKVTSEGSTLGTRAYMSPEQSSGREVDPRTDLWSLGVVLYELITGRLPFSGEHDAAMAYAIANETPDPLARYKADSTDELQRIVSKCLMKAPDERYQTAIGLLSDLRGLKRGAGALESTGPTEKTRKMLAVLPFENLGPAEDEYFADGITEEIISRLAAVKELGVISRTSVMQYKGTRKAMREIGTELGADHILEGTVRWGKAKSGTSRVRITPQLIKVADDTHLWSDRYDRELEDIFEVQSDIAEQVIEQLNVTLIAPERAAIMAQPTENLDAYHAYLRGREYLNRPTYSQRDFTLAVEMYERAVALDPNFALAWAGLGRAHSSFYHFGFDRSEFRKISASTAIEKAVTLQPDEAGVQLAAGIYQYRCTNDYAAALKNLERALASAPNSSEVWESLGAVRRRRGDIAGGLEGFTQALKRDPRNSLLQTEIGLTLSFMHRWSEANQCLQQSVDMEPDQLVAYWALADNYIGWKGDLPAARRMIERISPQFQLARMSLFYRQFMFERRFADFLEYIDTSPLDFMVNQGWAFPKSLLRGQALAKLGRTKEARDAFRDAEQTLSEAIARTPNDYRLYEGLGQAYAYLDKKDQAGAAGRKAMELCPLEHDVIRGIGPIYGVAGIYAMIGEVDHACALLERVFSHPCIMSRTYARLDPAFDPLHGHARFEALMAQEDKVFQ